MDYCQYLLSTPINYTLTHFADHSENFSHDQINRYLANDRLRPRQVWEHVKSDLEQTPDGCLIFDDTVLDKRDRLGETTIFWQRPENDKRYRKPCDVCLRQSGVRPIWVD